MTGDQLFIRLARTASRFTGRSLSFVLALVVVVAWLVSGPLFDYSDTWQLVINTATTIVTFLLSLAAWNGASEDEIIAHCEAVAAEMPLFGFYLQPAVGGVKLPSSFWKRFAAIENVVAIKMAPFNRYATLDVIRGVLEAGAKDRVALYTGNDDHIVADLLTPFRLAHEGRQVTMRIVGGLLGHWSVWTRSAVQIQARCRDAARKNQVPSDLLALDAAVTEMNAAVFDVANDFHGVIAGCHEVLRRQGLLEGIWCLDEHETLSPGQAELLTVVAERYPLLTDDGFIRDNLHRWLS